MPLCLYAFSMPFGRIVGLLGLVLQEPCFFGSTWERERDNYRQLTTMFLNFQQISGWCSYKLGSYKKKRVFDPRVGPFDPRVYPFELIVGPFELLFSPNEPQLIQNEPQLIPFEPLEGLFEPWVYPFEPQICPIASPVGQYGPQVGQYEHNLAHLSIIRRIWASSQPQRTKSHPIWASSWPLWAVS